MTGRIVAFPPIVPAKPRTLILGSMPGGRSLERAQYYAHPQNQFWRFMGDIYGASPSLPYEERVAILKANQVAVWDVLESCIRRGSMDADIKNPRPNDFAAFFDMHPGIKLVVFDSQTAATFYRRLVLPALDRDLVYRSVPSPSPAYARMRYEEKLVLWKEALLTAP